MRLLPATDAELTVIARWLAAPTVWADAFLLPAEPDAPWVQASMLMVKQGPRLELTQARFWGVHDETSMVGFAIDYGWDTRDDTQREIDVAFPGSEGKHARHIVDLFGQLLAAMFERGAHEVRCRVRAGKHGGPDRLFARIGAEPVEIETDRHPVSGDEVRRAHYRCTPKSFYASPYFRMKRAGS
jgi:hypothetical protein